MKSIIDNWNKYTNEVLNESSFSRIKRMVDEGKQPFVVISAARDDLGKDEAGNQKRGKMLKSDLKAAGYPFTQVLGAGQEEPVEECPSDRTIQEEGGEGLPGLKALAEGKPAECRQHGKAQPALEQLLYDVEADEHGEQHLSQWCE